MGTALATMADQCSCGPSCTGTFKWLNRHRSSAAEAHALRTEHHSSSAQQPRQQPDKAQKHVNANEQPLNGERAKSQDRTGSSQKPQQPARATHEVGTSADRQAQLQKRWQMEQANADYRAFKSTDASWQPDKSLWKTQSEEPKGSRDKTKSKSIGSATSASTSEAESGQIGQRVQEAPAQGQASPGLAAASSASQSSQPQPPRLR